MSRYTDRPATPPSPLVGKIEEDWGNDPPYELTNLQFRAIELSLEGTSDTQIARTLGIDRKTLWNWKTHDVVYARALCDARLQVFGEVADRYRTLLTSATIVMAKFLTHDDENHRFRAAYALLMMAGSFKPPPLPELPGLEPIPTA